MFMFIILCSQANYEELKAAEISTTPADEISSQANYEELKDYLPCSNLCVEEIVPRLTMRN